MKSIIEEFKKFALRGNVVDLAVAVVIGGAFGKIVSSLVETIITPSVGLLLGGIDFTSYIFQVGSASIRYGAFIQSVVDFLIIAWVIFIVIRLMSTVLRTAEEKPAPKEPSEEILLLREIRDAVRRDSHTS